MGKRIELIARTGYTSHLAQIVRPCPTLQFFSFWFSFDNFKILRIFIPSVSFLATDTRESSRINLWDLCRSCSSVAKIASLSPVDLRQCFFFWISDYTRTFLERSHKCLKCSLKNIHTIKDERPEPRLNIFDCN